MKRILIIIFTLTLTSCAAWKEGQKKEENFIEPAFTQKHLYEIRTIKDSTSRKS